MSMQPILKSWTALRAVGPYLLIELLLPGGTLFALLLWLSQRFARNSFRRELFSARRRDDAAAESPRAAKTSPVKPVGCCAFAE